MPKAKGTKEGKCPNCDGKGTFDDDGVEITCPCKALEE